MNLPPIQISKVNRPYLSNGFEAVRLCLKVYYGQLCRANTVQVSAEPNLFELCRVKPVFLQKKSPPQIIPTIRTSWLARSFLGLPRNQPFVVFLCHVFCNQPFFHSDVFLQKPLFQPSLKKAKKHARKKQPDDKVT